MYSVGFLDPKTMGLDTKINVIGDTEAEKCEFIIFLAAILNLLFLERIFGVTSWFPLFLESACQKKTTGRIFLLSSQSTRPFHIRPTKYQPNIWHIMCYNANMEK